MCSKKNLRNNELSPFWQADYDNKAFVLELFKLLRFYARKWAVKIENFEKKKFWLEPKF
jgi:hypothetical protein